MSAAAGQAEAVAEVARLRSRIAVIDRSIVNLLGERVALAREGGRLKRRAGLPILDPAREAAVVRGAVEVAREVGVDEEAIRNVLWEVIGLCRRAQADRGEGDAAGEQPRP